MINTPFALVVVLALCAALAGAQQAGSDVSGAAPSDADRQQVSDSAAAVHQIATAPVSVLFCKFEGTKQKYPVVTWGMVALGALFSAATYYHYDQAESNYQEYLAATDDTDILRYRDEAERNDNKAVRFSCAAAACFVLAAASFMVRTPVPAEQGNQKADAMMGLNIVAQAGSGGGLGVALSLRMRP